MLEVLNHIVWFVKCAYKHALDLYALQEGKRDRTVYKLPAGSKKSQKFIFEELERIPRSTDFRDVIVALKHVINKRQTSRFSVIILIPEPTARRAVPGVSPGRGLLIPH